MKRYLAPLLVFSLALSACGNAVGMPSRDEALQDHLRNPLYAEFYYDDLTEQMVNLALQEDPILEDSGIRAIVDRTRTRSLEHAGVAVDAQIGGARGKFIGDRGLASGEALLLDDVLYVGPTFDSAPGPKLSMYLTAALDPRDVEFPDDTAVRLGSVKNQYGAHSYAVPKQLESTGTGSRLRTAVLWDDELGVLYGFAQLARVLP
jgi:hypothetical protein